MPQIHVNGARHFYRLEGDPTRPLLALLHPVGADHSIWDKVVPGLLPKFRVLRTDLRGHGGSEATAGDYTLDMLARDFLDIAEKLGLTDISLCGISLGGMTAVRAVNTRPERFKSVAICSAAPKLPPPPGGWDGRAQQAIAGGMLPLAGPMVERFFSAAYKATQDPVIGTMRTVFEQMDPQGYASSCAVFRDSDISEECRQVRVPAIVISGENDALIPGATAAFMAEALRADHVALNCGHFPPLEAPDDFSKALVPHFEKS